MGWRRKHVCDLAGVCKKYGEEPSLPANQREKFAKAYTFAKQFASFPNAGDSHNVTAVIAMVCGACQATFDHGCAGRYDWQDPCVLMQTRVAEN